MSEYKTLQENQTLNLEYQRNKELREKDKEIERLNNIRKEVLTDLEDTKNYNDILPITDDRGNKFVMMDIDHINYLIRILEGNK